MLSPMTSQRTEALEINYRDELIRKGIHLCSLSIPVIYYFITRETAVYILAGVTAFALILDLARYLSPGIKSLFLTVFGFMLRKHELDDRKKNLNGATYVFISALLCVIIFPKVLFLTAFPILIVSDSAAALIGRKYGIRPFLKKSLGGTIAFFLSALIVILFTPKLGAGAGEYLIAAAAAAVAAIIENISHGWADDNLSIPMTVGFVMWGLFILFMPEVQLILPNVPR